MVEIEVSKLNRKNCLVVNKWDQYEIQKTHLNFEEVSQEIKFLSEYISTSVSFLKV